MKTVLITGATSGIGKACAMKFGEAGYHVIAWGRNKEKLTGLNLQMQGEIMPMGVDVCNREQVKLAIERIHADWKPIDVLINNAGLAQGLEPEYEGNFDDWDRMIDTNVKGLLNVTRLVVPEMVRRNHGHVINIGSVAGDAAYAGGNVYCATKAAVKALTDGLRIDVAHTRVRVTNLKPGLVETNFSNTKASNPSRQMILPTWPFTPLRPPNMYR